MTTKHLNFVYGFDVGMDLRGDYQRDENRSTYRDNTSLSPGIWLILGANYVLKEHWIFSLELRPYFNSTIALSNSDNGWFGLKKNGRTIRLAMFLIVLSPNSRLLTALLQKIKKNLENFEW